jgi:hypothetical protein
VLPPTRHVPSVAVGFDRSDPAIVEALSASAAALAHRVNAVASGRVEIRDIAPLELRPRLRGADPRRLVGIRVACRAVEDEVACIEWLHDLGHWPADGSSALIFVRDALRGIATRLSALDRLDVHDDRAARIAASLGEGRVRLRHGYRVAGRLEHADALARQVIHLAAIRRLLSTSSTLARATELAVYARG